MKCEQVQPKLSAYYDGELGASVRQRLAAHLGCCPDCCAHLRDLAAISEAFCSCRCCETPRRLWQRISAAVCGTSAGNSCC